MAEATWEGQVRLPDGYERFVKRFGEGSEVIVGQHGGPGANLRSMEPLGGLADEQVQVVLYDQLGGGRSSRPDDDSLWTVETFVGEFELLVAELGLGKVHLLGQSWGGMLALECALRTPQLVKSLILCDTMASTQSAVDGFVELLAAAPQAARDAVAAGLQFDPDDDSEQGRALLDLYATHVHRSTPFDIETSRREFLEEIMPLLEDIGPAYEAMWGPSEFAPDGVLRDWDVSGRLGEIEVPTLVTCGAYDELTPESCHRPIVEGIADVRWLILGQSSHATFHEAEADVLLAAIRDFVLRVSSASAKVG